MPRLGGCAEWTAGCMTPRRNPAVAECRRSSPATTTSCRSPRWSATSARRSTTGRRLRDHRRRRRLDRRVAWRCSSALAEEVPELRIVRHERNRGYGGALISGFAAATEDWVFYTDGDAQYDATELARCIDAAAADVDIVQGCKIGRGDPWYRKVIGREYHHVVHAAVPAARPRHRLRLPPDPSLAARPGRAALDVRRDLRRDDAQVPVAGARFVEVGVSHYERPHGRSQFFRLPAIARSPRPRGAVVGARRAPPCVTTRPTEECPPGSDPPPVRGDILRPPGWRVDDGRAVRSPG